MELASDAMFLLQETDLTCIDANTAACRMLGYTHEELQATQPVLRDGVSLAQLNATLSDDTGSESKLARASLCRKDGISLLLDIQRCARVPGSNLWLLVGRASALPQPMDIQSKMAQANAELARLSIELQTVREEERKNLATRLHGDLGQLLAALRINLTLLQQQFPETAACGQVLTSMDKLVVSSIASLRRLSAELRPKSLAEGELFHSLHMLRQEAAARHGFACELQAQETDLLLDDVQSTMIFRLTQDALMHVFPHFPTARVLIDCSRQDKQLRMRFQTDGLDLASLDEHHAAAYGLAAMRERVNILQGQMELSNPVEPMNAITISLPIGEQ